MRDADLPVVYVNYTKLDANRASNTAGYPWCDDVPERRRSGQPDSSSGGTT